MWNAGSSARKWGREAAWEASSFRRMGLPTGLFASMMFGLAISGTSLFIVVPCSLIFFVYFCAALKARDKSRSVQELRRDAINRKAGGKDEMRSAWEIHRSFFWKMITGRGPCRALHDRKIPKSGANLDHIVITRQGVTYVDRKRWTSKFEMYNDQLFYGYSKTHNTKSKPVKVDPTKFEADEIAKVLNKGTLKKFHVPLRVCWSVSTHNKLQIHDTQRRAVYRSWELDEVKILDKRDSRKFIHHGPKVLTRKEVKEVWRVLNKSFPPK